MDFPVFDAELEIRARGDKRVLSGKFPYNKTATIRDRGKVRKERIGKRAFGWQIKRFQELQDELSTMIGDTVDQVRKELLEEQLERANVHISSPVIRVLQTARGYETWNRSGH